jgi:hypothetical protein
MAAEGERSQVGRPCLRACAGHDQLGRVHSAPGKPLISVPTRKSSPSQACGRLQRRRRNSFHRVSLSLPCRHRLRGALLHALNRGRSPLACRLGRPRVSEQRTAALPSTGW